VFDEEDAYEANSPWVEGQQINFRLRKRTKENSASRLAKNPPPANGSTGPGGLPVSPDDGSQGILAIQMQIRRAHLTQQVITRTVGRRARRKCQ
jgi:hypothetical protein